MEKKFYDFVRTRAEEYFQTLGFDEDTINVLLEQAVEDLRENLEKFNQWINNAQDSLDEIATLAHTIKGVLVNMGMEELGAKFKEVQNLVLEGANKEQVLARAVSVLEDLAKF